MQRTIDRLQLGEGTAIGEAVFSALEAINSPDPANNGDSSTPSTTAGAKTGTDELTGAIVLLSDGETTEGRPNDEAAQAATAAGVAVNTIAFGTDSGIVTGPDGTQIPVPVNRDALKTLADGTGGTYFSAFTADQLKQVYEKLGESVERTRPCTTRSPTGSRSRRWRSQSWPASARSSGSAACPDPHRKRSARRRRVP